MTPDREFSELIGGVYDCAIDASRWPGVLGQLCDVLDGLMADIGVFDALRGRARFVALHNWPDGQWERAESYLHLNPAMPLSLVQPLGEPFTSYGVMGAEGVRRLRYWQLCWADLGTGDVLAVPLSRETTRVSGWGVVRRGTSAPFGDAEIEFARMISPHMRRAVEISCLLADHRAVEGTLAGVLDALEAAAFVIGPDGALAYRNEAARAELADGAFVREQQGRLFGALPEIATLLAGLATEKGEWQRGSDVVFKDVSGRLRQVVWVRLDQAEHEMNAPFLVLLRSPYPELKTPLSSAARLYKLTAAETQTLAQILEGRSLEEAADVLGVARSTVKSHLAAIFAKSGTRRQTELVARVMGLLSPVA